MTITRSGLTYVLGATREALRPVPNYPMLRSQTLSRFASNTHVSGSINVHPGAKLRRAFSSIDRKNALVGGGADVSALASYIAALKRVDKVPLRIERPLKNGGIALVKRPRMEDVERLVAYFTENNLLSDVLATPDIRVARSKEIYWMASAERHDSIIAIVEGKMVALAEYDPRPHEMESDVRQSFLDQFRLTKDDVCVSRMIVSEAYRARGIGGLLKASVLRSAASAGYGAVVSETSSDAVKTIVKRLGGIVESEAWCTWTLVSTKGF